MSAGVDVLAHHALITALPFVVPAFLVVGMVIAVVLRDRREERAEAAAPDRTPRPPLD